MNIVRFWIARANPRILPCLTHICNLYRLNSLKNLGFTDTLLSSYLLKRLFCKPLDMECSRATTEQVPERPRPGGESGIAPLPSTTGVPISGFRCFRSPHRLKESGSLRSFELFEGLLQLLFPQQLRLGKVWGIRERT